MTDTAIDLFAWNESMRGITLGHRLWQGTKWLHIVRHTIEGPAAIHRQTLCGSLAKATIVDSGAIDRRTGEIDPTKARAFRYWYVNGFPPFTEHDPADSDIWCRCCIDAYLRQRDRAEDRKRGIA